jgi:anti-sigma factor RsiW
MKHLNDDELSSAIAGLELSPEAETHLAGCVSCRNEVEALGGAINERRAALESRAPDWQAQRQAVMDRLADRPAASRQTARRWVRPILAMAATLVVAVGVGVLAPPGAVDSPPAQDLPIEEILAEVDALLADDSLPGFESIDPGVDDPESLFENGTS